MIDHLHIKNFLAFPELDVPELKLINLVAGKNGVGKTALLEALALLKSRDSGVLSDVIRDRKLGAHNDTRTFIKVLNRESEFGPNGILINDLHLELSENDTKFEEVRNPTDKEMSDIARDIKAPPYAKPQYLFLKALADDSLIMSLWEKIKLTPLEDSVLEIVRASIRPDIVRFDVDGDNIIVRLENAFEPVNLYSLGSGVRRVLLLAMSLSKVRNGGLLLIDEIETHLHHSVIRKLWKIILEYAIKWNIQVVATTHSQDAIRQLFYEAAANEEYQKVSQVLRLQIGRSGKHEVIQYPYERLEFMMDTKLEIRGN